MVGKDAGKYYKDYSAYKITTGSEHQDLALVFGEGVEDEKYVSFSVKWLELAKVEVIKVDSNHENAKLSGAVFGIYNDKDCSELITEMPGYGPEWICCSRDCKGLRIRCT